jgi:hypothetical protein
MFYAEDENGNGRYLQDYYFIGTYSNACAYADTLGDAWEEKTGGLIVKLVIESHGKVDNNPIKPPADHVIRPAGF